MIRLLPFDLARIDALTVDSSTIDGIPVVDGGLPPPLIVDGAAMSLLAGLPALWFAPFAFVDVDGARIVGSGIFKGPPEDGRVEIGYGVAEGCRGRGHATDGASALVRLAFAQPDVRVVYAETSTVNAASRRVVQKVGFTHVGQRFDDEDGLVDCWVVAAPVAP